MNICFLEKTHFQYNSNDLYCDKLRGAETVLINLSKSLYKIGHKVTILNNCPENKIINGINWKNINHYKDNEHFDLGISNNDVKLFDKIKCNKKILISHSLQSLEKFIRKKQILSYLKHKPKVVLLSKYHKKNRSKLITAFGYIRLNWAVDDLFLNTKINDDFNQNRAIFTSKEDRNLNILLNIWINLIFPKFNKGELLTTPPNFKVENKSIIFRKKGSQSDLIKDILSSKIFLIPGHKAELFCLAAEEAKELCLPIVTLGIGSLSERVEHGVTGFIAKSDKEFANYTLDLFNNLEVYKNLRRNLIQKRGKKNWNDVSNNLIKLLYN
jgi:glycosyltransferase involved in cell wall biosynthesis